MSDSIPPSCFTGSFCKLCMKIVSHNFTSFTCTLVTVLQSPPSTEQALLIPADLHSSKYEHTFTKTCTEMVSPGVSLVHMGMHFQRVIHRLIENDLHIINTKCKHGRKWILNGTNYKAFHTGNKSYGTGPVFIQLAVKWLLHFTW